MKVYLLGYMGAGKSTYGYKLAKNLNIDFIDLDNYIENKYKFTISSFFKVLGEEAFRIIEHFCLKEISDTDNFIVATGGGTPCFFNNMEIIKKSGFSIYLRLTDKQLLNRLINAKKKRPLIKNKTNEELLSFISKTLYTREKFYLQSDAVIDAIDLKTSDLINIVENKIANWDY